MPASDRARNLGTVLVTGCSSGIGLATARVLRDRGWRVLATARRAEDHERLARDERLETIALELADPAAVRACAREALALAGGRIDALFNNAAYGQPGAVEDLPAEVLSRQFAVNVVGTHELTRALIPAMRAAGRGRIVQCSSVLGIVAAPWRGAYCASKFALEALSDAMRMELAGSGLHVSIIEPGPIRSRFVEHAVAAARVGIDIAGSVHRARYETMLRSLEAGGRQRFKLEPEAVARKVVHALESPRPKPRYFVTTPTHLAAVARRVLPTRLLDRLARHG
jgi:NAD(P)-dependent dehydrogenase (short-subunit alcohol dehydrogenase family)